MRMAHQRDQVVTLESLQLRMRDARQREAGRRPAARAAGAGKERDAVLVGIECAPARLVVLYSDVAGDVAGGSRRILHPQVSRTGVELG
jgi:hypothetical protein